MGKPTPVLFDNDSHFLQADTFWQDWGKRAMDWVNTASLSPDLEQIAPPVQSGAFVIIGNRAFSSFFRIGSALANGRLLAPITLGVPREKQDENHT
jgi:hypothetical protein